MISFAVQKDFSYMSCVLFRVREKDSVHSSTCSYLDGPATFVANTVFSPICIVGLYVVYFSAALIKHCDPGSL